jgi:hypothetical protein
LEEISYFVFVLIMDSPWDETPGNTTHQDVEWSRISSEFTNVRMRCNPSFFVHTETILTGRIS